MAGGVCLRTRCRVRMGADVGARVWMGCKGVGRLMGEGPRRPGCAAGATSDLGMGCS